MTDFTDNIQKVFSFDNPSIALGSIMHDGAVHAEVQAKIPLAMMNRHGLIAGSTGTGKTRTLQLLAEGLSRAGVPSFVSDVKGDLSGLCKPGVVNPKILERLAGTGKTFTPEGFPVEFYSLTGNRGTQLRATVSSFGPILLSKVLGLTSTQQSVLAMVFKYCDDRQMPLLDFTDLRDVLNYLGNEGKAELKDYGGMSPATVGVLIRKMVELEQQGASKFFGEPELDIHDLIRTTSDGRGIINVLSLSDVQDKPRLFSTFLMWLLGQFYFDLPEVGDADKPKLVFFFDEAHLLFDDASSELTEHIVQVARLIRSKGIGVFFITQTPKDVDQDVLAQLGNRIQHAVRAFTPQDAKNLKATASTFPTSEFYDIGKTLTSLGTGEALVSVLNPKGVPTAVAITQIFPPSSVMGAADDADYNRVIAASTLASKYATAIDRESAHEILQKKISSAAQATAQNAAPSAPSRGTRQAVPVQEKSVLAEVLNSPVARQVGRQAARTITSQVLRGLFGMLKR
ncbi:MAG TPA: helicase HerA-like domain-containing protein [Thermoanaerobaculia bacterium]|nr:helicase HerA-like domain-containing protein [Thermoanaerobaculia bacterium]